MNNSVSTVAQIGQIVGGRVKTSLTVGELDQIISLMDKHIAEAEREIAAGIANGYAYGPTTRAKFAKLRKAAARKLSLSTR